MEKIKTKQYSFFYHYNKPASRVAGEPRLSIHYRGQCHIVNGLKCAVPTYSRVRTTQPHIVMAGRGNLTIQNGKAIIE